MDETQYRELLSFDWKKITLTLTAYAVAVFKFKKITRINSFEPKDFVQEAVTLLFEGKRKWNKKTTPDITNYLKSVIKSLISNELTRKTLPTVEIDKEKQQFIENNNTTIFTAEDIEICKGIKQELKKAVKGDEILEVYIEYLDYEFEDEVMAEACKVSVNDIKTAKRRLRNKVNKIKDNE